MSQGDGHRERQQCSRKTCNTEIKNGTGRRGWGGSLVITRLLGQGVLARTVVAVAVAATRAMTVAVAMGMAMAMAVTVAVAVAVAMAAVASRRGAVRFGARREVGRLLRVREQRRAGERRRGKCRFESEPSRGGLTGGVSNDTCNARDRQTDRTAEVIQVQIRIICASTFDQRTCPSSRSAERNRSRCSRRACPSLSTAAASGRQEASPSLN